MKSLFPARAALNVSISYSRRLRFNSLFESGFRWRLFRDLNPLRHFPKLALTNSIFVLKVSVSTTNSTKSHFKAHFSLSFATVSLAVVSLYFKCALEWRPYKILTCNLSLRRRLLYTIELMGLYYFPTAN